VSQSVLVVDAGGHPLEALAERLRLLGIPTVRAKTGGEARVALADPRHSIGAVVIPPDPPTLDLPVALRALTAAPGGNRRTLLVAGPRPDAETRARLREAGARLALFEPFDDHTLRFQVNRALAEGTTDYTPRGALRAPIDWPVEVRSGRRTRPARLYSLSARGAFLATPGPSLRDALVHVVLPLAPRGGTPLRVAGQVVSTNVPGNLRRRNLPLGMGVRFIGLRDEAVRVLDQWAQDRAAALAV